MKKGFLRRCLSGNMRTLSGVFWPLFWFELVFHMVRTVLVRPLLSRIVQVLLSLSGHRLAFNESVFSFFLTPPGLLAALVWLALAALFIYFEFSTIILLAYHQYGGEKVRVRQAAKEALTTGSALKGFGFFGFCAYTMLLLPVTGVGLSSSLVPDFDIPAFVTGELQKTWYGALILVALAGLALFLVRGMLFVLPVMVLEGRRFFGAVARSWSMQVKTKLRILFLIALFFLAGLLLVAALVVVELVLLGGLPDLYALDDLLLNNDALWRVVAALLLVVLSQLFQIVVMPLLLTFLVTLYMELDPRVQLDADALFRIDRRIARARGRLEALLIRLRPSLENRPEKRARVLRRLLRAGWLVFVALLFTGVVQLAYTGTPQAGQRLVIGHRGSAYGVENTLPAVQGAIDSGADYAEIDVLLSKDSVPMVIHDASLRRLAGLRANVADLTAVELQALTLREDGYEGRIPTLEELLAFCDGRQKLLIEFKQHGAETESVVAKTLEVVERMGFEDQAIYHTLVYSYLREAKQLCPSCQVGYITYASIGSLSAQNLRELGCDFIVIEEGMATDRLMGEASIANMPVFVWTVNDADRMREYYEMGATSIITDYPDVGVAQLEAMGWFHFANGYSAADTELAGSSVSAAAGA